MRAIKEVLVAGTLTAEMLGGPVLATSIQTTTAEAASCNPIVLNFSAGETKTINIKRGWISGDVYVTLPGSAEKQEFDSGTPDSAHTGSIAVFKFPSAENVQIRSQYGASGLKYPGCSTETAFEKGVFQAEQRMYNDHKAADPNFRPDPWFNQ